jgi:DNA-binding NarL/FixJ family response regulator
LGAAPPQRRRGRRLAASRAREGAIVPTVLQWLTTCAISRQLWVIEHTVKFHLTNIYRKLGVTNRSGAVRYAVENELAPLPARAEATA